MSRCLLHVSKVPDFIEWCKSKGIATRDGRGEYELFQIQPIGSKIWMCLYRREVMPEHVTIDYRLHRLVKNFIQQTKCSTR